MDCAQEQLQYWQPMLCFHCIVLAWWHTHTTRAHTNIHTQTQPTFIGFLFAASIKLFFEQRWSSSQDKTTSVLFCFFHNPFFLLNQLLGPLISLCLLAQQYTIGGPNFYSWDWFQRPLNCQCRIIGRKWKRGRIQISSYLFFFFFFPNKNAILWQVHWKKYSTWHFSTTVKKRNMLLCSS